MRVLVCGSRELPPECRKMLETVLSGIRGRCKQDEDFVVIHGAADGADSMAKDWARSLESSGVIEDPHPADWNKHGKSAGPIRNREMYKKSMPDLVVAFPHADPAKRRGTDDMIAVAEAGGTPVWVVERRAGRRPIYPVGVTEAMFEGRGS